jgi:hypothetical protein
MNGNKVNYRWREIIGLECETLDSVIVHFKENITFFDDEFCDKASNTIVFAPTSHLVVNYTFSFKEHYVKGIMDLVPRPKDICDQAVLRCGPSLFPYNSLEECYRIMPSIPKHCDPLCFDCWEMNAPFQGGHSYLQTSSPRQRQSTIFLSLSSLGEHF